MDIIHLLPDAVANQIAAGEVIQRPASVLKELVENSIDADAKHIQIILKDAGRTLIQITDDGKGMSETDARIAFERHATSKIKEAADLFNLQTMGFRGEALASIAAVAHVELRTRRADDELGTFIEIAGSRVFRQEPVQCPLGTTFSIKNLFFNVPARRRFLKSNATELRNLLNEFHRIALVNPQVAFTLFSDDEELFNLPESTLKQRIEGVFGKSNKKNFAQQLLTLEAKTTLLNIHGFVGKPEFAQKNAQQYFFVNGRYMRHPYFHKAVMSAYQGMIHGETSPSYFLYFEINPEMIDVNIHPTKTEIKFSDEQTIWSILMAAVKETLGKFNVVSSIDFDQEGSIEMPITTQIDLSKVKTPQTVFNPNYNPFGNKTTYKRQSLDWEKLYDGFEHKKETETQNVSTNSDQMQLNIESKGPDVFQFKTKYILTPVKSGLMIIDQQRAHFCILYNQFRQQLQSKQGVSQQMLFPEILELSVDDTVLVEQLLTDLKSVGFDIAKFGKNAFSINGVPADLCHTDPLKTLHEILENAKNTAINTVQNRCDAIAISLAKAACMNAGKELTELEMNDIIERLFACDVHAVTPEGKAVATILTQEELEKRLK